MSHLGSICSSSNDTPVLILQHLVFVFTGLYLKLINTHRILGQTYLGMAKSAPGLLHGHKLPQYHSETINIRFLIWRLTTEKFWGHPFRLKKKNNHRSYMLNDVFQMEKFWGHLQAERGKRRRERKTKMQKGSRCISDKIQLAKYWIHDFVIYYQLHRSWMMKIL